MVFDLGLQGLGLLAIEAVIFGVVVQLLLGRTASWLGLLGGVAWFVGGLLASEVMWGTMTEDEIQPIIDGLAFDESLLGGLVIGVPVTIIGWLVARREAHRPTHA